ncbi:hypothetical protein [Paenibacillus sp. HJGM_3]|uniref:hypothetical protein n=1 Tax=Paenibacillus sp. HJGM_3 TaxID=3379816 RepID=UPI00385FFA75
MNDRRDPDVHALRDPDRAEAVMREHIHRSYREFADIGSHDKSELARNGWI